MADGERKNATRKGCQASGRDVGRGPPPCGSVEGLKDGFAQKDKKKTKGRLECGRKVNIENHETRSAAMEKRERSGWVAPEKDKDTNGSGTKGTARAQESPEIKISIFLGLVLREQYGKGARPRLRRSVGARASRPRGFRKAENKRKRQCFL